MRIQITSRRCQVPDAVLTRVEELIEKLVRYEPALSAAEVILEEEKRIRRAEAILSVDRAEPVVAKGEGEEFRTAIDQMVDRLSKKLRRLHSQRTDRQGPRHAGGERMVAD